MCLFNLSHHLCCVGKFGWPGLNNKHFMTDDRWQRFWAMNFSWIKTWAGIGSLQNVSKYVKISVKICQTVPWRLWPHYVVCQSVWPSVNLWIFFSLNLSNCAQICPNMSKSIKMCQNVPWRWWPQYMVCLFICLFLDFFKMFQNLSKYFKMSKNVSKYAQNVSKCVQMCQNVPKCVNMFKNYIIAWPSVPVGSNFLLWLLP